MTHTEDSISPSTFHLFLENFKLKLKEVYSELSNTDYITTTRGIPALVLKEIIPLNPLAVIISKEYGGISGKIDENLLMTSAAAYESLAFSLTLGINSALFLQPVTKFAKEEIKKKVFNGFLNEKKMGGLMITEPDFGSDALNMRTFFTKSDTHFQLKGTKHWAGLTGFANYWLLTAREQTENGQLKRDLDFFICDTDASDQQIVVEEYFDNLGLHHIPYGRNRIDVKIPTQQRLDPKTTGINVLLDTLHRSRLQFPAMGLGFIQRMMDEAILHCKQRSIGGKSLFTYDQVQYRLARLQSYFTICSAMCAYSSKNAGLEKDLSTCGIEANSFKTIATDMMQDAAQSLVQLVGAKAYRYSHIGGRGIIDSRPFQIFEGSNDILYAQISEGIIKLMKQKNETNPFLFLSEYIHSKQAALVVKEQLDFNINLQLNQRKQIEFGKIISRIISIEMVINIGNSNFRKDLVSNSIAMLQTEISGLIGNFKQIEFTNVIEDYKENSSWYKNF